MSMNTSVIELVHPGIVPRGGATCSPREIAAEIASRATGQIGLPPSARHAAAPQAPLRLGEQPASGLPKYRDFERRRRHAQIAARHALAGVSAI